MDPKTCFAIARHARKVYEGTLRDLAFALFCPSDSGARKVIRDCVDNSTAHTVEDLQRALEDHWEREQERSNTGDGL